MELYTYRVFLTKLDKTLICELDFKDFTYTEYLSEADEIEFPIDKFLNGVSSVVDNRFDLVKNLYWILLEKYSGDNLLSSKYFSIVEPTQSYDNGKTEIKVKAIGTDYQEFNRRKVRGYNEASVTLSAALNYVVTNVLYGTWTIGTLPTKATTEYHTVIVDEDTVTSFFQMIQTNWDVLIIPDTNLNVINVYDRDSYGTQTDLVLSSGNFINSASFTPKMDQLTTRLYVYGKDDLGISSVNPLGTSYIDDFTYFYNNGYFSPSLTGAYNLYLIKVQSYTGQLQGYLSSLNSWESQLLTTENLLVNLNAQKVIYDNAMSIYQSANKRNAPDYQTIYNNWLGVKSDIANAEVAKSNIELEINNLNAQIQAIGTELAYTNLNNFTSNQLQELSHFIYESTLTVDTITETSVLYDYGVAYLTAKNAPIYEIDLDSIDLFGAEETASLRSLINVGDYIWLDLSEVSLDWVSLQLVSYTHNPFQNKLSFKFSNTNKIESSLYYLNDVFKKANAASVAVQNNAANWGEYVLDKPAILTNTSEIDAEKNIIRAGPGNTIDHRGFVGTDIGSAPNSHLKLLDDKIVLTRDEWQTFDTVFSSEGVDFRNTQNTSRVIITPTTGIQIDKNVAATPLSGENWDNRFYADTDGNLFIEGNIFVGDSAENIVIDRYGLDPTYAIWFKNMLPNTDGAIAETPPIANYTDNFVPWMWLNCQSSMNSTFRTGRSFAVAYNSTMASDPRFEAAKCNPATLPTGTRYMRFSWWSKFAQAEVKIKDFTNSNYFSIAKGNDNIVVGTYSQTFSRHANWVDKPDSIWFDLQESGHSSCVDIRVEIKNVYNGETLYISGPQLTIDKTGKWPQSYISGPFSLGDANGNTVTGSGLDPNGGGGSLSVGNLYVAESFPSTAPNNAVLVDTNDYSRYDRKTLSVNTTLAYIDNRDNEYLNITGTTTITLFNASIVETEGSGKVAIFIIKNTGTGLVTISGTIDGASSWLIYPGEQYTFYSAGSEWKRG